MNDDSATNNNREGSTNSDIPEKYGTNGDISKDYDTILKESAVLTTVSGFLFAFLLNISINRPSDFSFEDGIILMIALFTITFATSLLSMPVFYHHLQYPYRNIEKFKLRSHRFIVFWNCTTLYHIVFRTIVRTKVWTSSSFWFTSSWILGIYVFGNTVCIRLYLL